MKLFLPYFLAYLLGWLCGYVLYLRFAPNPQQKKLTAEIVRGAETQTLKQGEAKEKKKFTSAQNGDKLKPEAVTVTDTLNYSCDYYKLSLIATHKDSVQIDWFLALESKELERVDTLEVTRTDTVKVKEVLEIEKPQPFYNSFWAGVATATVAVVIYLVTSRK